MPAPDEGDDARCAIEIDWARCPLLESVPGRVSGAWVIKGTRMPAQIIAGNHDRGMGAPEIADTWDLDPIAVGAIVAFAAEYRAEARARLLASPEFAALLDAAPEPPPVDWGGCPVVEWMAGEAHDTWVLRGTPTPADMLMGHHDDGWPLEDIAKHYGWDRALIEALVAFGEAQRAGGGRRRRADARVTARGTRVRRSPGRPGPGHRPSAPAAPRPTRQGARGPRPPSARSPTARHRRRARCRPPP